jgi:nucleoside-diphosphate-sugar epimerase
VRAAEGSGPRWLVLGSSGYLGAAIAEVLERQGVCWLGTRSAHGRDPSRNPVTPAFDLADRAALDKVLRSFRPTVVAHAVGHRPGASEAELRQLYVAGTETLLEVVAEAAPDCRMLLLGSAAEYGNAPPGGRSTEEDPPRPLSAYGRQKAEQSALGLAARERGFDLVVSRVFNLTGPGQGPKLLAGALLERLGRGENPLAVQAANHVRDWLDVRDAAEGLVALGAAPAPPPVVNVCSGLERTVAELAGELCRLAGAALEAISGPDSAEVLWRSVGGDHRLRELGWRPRVPFEQSLLDQWRAVGSPRTGSPTPGPRH